MYVETYETLSRSRKFLFQFYAYLNYPHACHRSLCFISNQASLVKVSMMLHILYFLHTHLGGKFHVKTGDVFNSELKHETNNCIFKILG